MSDNSRRKAKSVYFFAIASALSPLVAAQGAYQSANTFDLFAAPSTESNAFASAGSLQYGTAKISSLKTAMVWNGYSLTGTSLNPAGMTESYILGGIINQQVGAAYGVSTGSTDNAFLWNLTAASAINLNPAGFNQSYAQATDGTHQVGLGQGTVATGNSFHAMMWTGSVASFVDLHPASGFTQSYAYGVDGNQQVGFATTPKAQGNTFDHALLWSGTAASVVDLHPASGYTGTYAYGIAGGKEYGFGWGSSTGGNNHALVWSGTAASVVDIHPTLGLNQSKIYSAYDTRQVGWAWSTTNQEHAVVWAGTAASAIDLHALLPGAPTKSFARSVDVYGNVTGEAYYAGVQHAVVWQAGTTLRLQALSPQWNSTASWLSNSLPVAGGEVLLLQSDATNRTLNYANATNPAYGKLTLDATSTGTMTLTQSQDSLTTTDDVIGLLGNGKIDQSGGTHTVTGTLTLAARAGATGTYLLSNTGNLNANNLTINAGGTFTQTGGTLNATSTLNAGTLSLAGTANVGSLNAVTVGTTSAQLSAVGTTTIAANAIVTAQRLRQNSLTLDGTAGNNLGKLTIPESAPGLGTGVPSGNDAMVSIVHSITIANDGLGNYFSTLDLVNNDLIIDYTGGPSPLNQIEAMVKSAYNSGTWAGKGITSSVAATSPGLYHLAVADNALLGGVALNSFDGINTSSHQQIIVKFTWVADINLDGFVDANDAIAFATNYSEGLTGTHHQFGDLNYDGTINFNDAILFSTAYNSSLPHLPEPTSLTFLTLGALALLKRKRS